jgi:tetratricopeptide (TPR) repeat protein
VEKARKLDPLSPYVSVVLMLVLMFGNRNEEAVRERERTLELDPDFVIGLYILGSTLTRVGRYDRAIELLEKAAAVTGRASFYLGFLGWAYGRAGREVDAREILSELEERAKEIYVSPIFFVCVHAGLGEDDRLFHYLERARDSGSPLGIFTRFPIFDGVRSDPRFERMTASIGLRDA